MIEQPTRPKQYSVQVSTTVTRNKCGRCRAEVYAGWFDALPITYDRHSLSQTGELMALLRGVRTFLLVDNHTHKRKAHAIKANPFPSFGVLLREHFCGVPITDIELRTTEDHSYDDTEPGF